jgi:hypothetical protein
MKHFLSRYNQLNIMELGEQLESLLNIEAMY